MSRSHPSDPIGASASPPPNDQLFAAAFENAPHPMALIGSNGILLQANRSLCGFLGFTRSELCALKAGDIVHPDDVCTEHEQRKRLAAADIGRYDLVQRYVRKDLRTVWARVSVSAVRSALLDETFFVAELEPVPPHNCAEAEAGDEVWFARLGEASLSAVHEIGNTLTALMLNTEMLVERPRSEDVSEAAEAIFKAARRIAFALRRLRRVQDPVPVAYVGQNRLLDLRLLAPPSQRKAAPSSEAGAA